MRKFKFRFYCNNNNGSTHMDYSPDLRKWSNIGLKNLIIDDFYTSDNIMQYVGIKDCNNECIYENDIIKAYWYFDDDENNDFTIEEIIWSEEKLGFRTKEGLNHLNQIEKIEVIGNIWENPELLKNKEKLT